ncbi:hypothetical protein ACH4GG_13690 [Streptomyces albidoflavus]|uniref:hypothetical protein n=1 Tax=Streptomyces TaxID=1883 RepID=UPI001F5E0E3D|nr:MULTISPECIES: hypothetical protein [Streptomyces]
MPHLLRLHPTAPGEAAGPHTPGRTAPTEDGGAILAQGTDRAGIERIAAVSPFVAYGVAEYAIATTLTPGRVHPAAARLLAEDD